MCKHCVWAVHVRMREQTTGSYASNCTATALWCSILSTPPSSSPMPPSLFFACDKRKLSLSKKLSVTLFWASTGKVKALDGVNRGPRVGKVGVLQRRMRCLSVWQCEPRIAGNYMTVSKSWTSIGDSAIQNVHCFHELYTVLLSFVFVFIFFLISSKRNR